MGGWVRVAELRRLKVIEDNLRRWKNIQNVVGSEHHLSRGKQLTSGECILHLSLSRSVLSGRICQLGPTGAPNSQYKKTMPNLDSRYIFLPYVRDIWQNYSNCYISNFCRDFWTLQFEKYTDLRTADIGRSTTDAEPVDMPCGNGSGHLRGWRGAIEIYAADCIGKPRTAVTRTNCQHLSFCKSWNWCHISQMLCDIELQY